MSIQGSSPRGLAAATRSWCVGAVAALAFMGSAPAVGQEKEKEAEKPAEKEKTFSEKAKEYWEKVVAGLEAGASSAGDEYRKLKAEAAEASGPAREKMAAEMEAAGTRWAAARRKLAGSLEDHAHLVHERIKAMEMSAAKATGPARETLDAEMATLRENWGIATDKASAALSANMKAAGDEYAGLKAEAGNATEGARARLAPRLEALKGEWSKDREKLAAFLRDDLRRTKDDLDKFGEATSGAAKAAKEKLAKKYHELVDKSDALAKDKPPDDAK